MSEKISALIDGELEKEQGGQSIRSLLSNKADINKSRQYQLIGDAMRGDNALNVDLTDAIMAQIELEPTILSPSAVKPIVTPSEGERVEAENVTHLNQRLPKRWSIAASVAAVMAVSMFMLNQQGSTPNEIQGLAIAIDSPNAVKTVPVVAAVNNTTSIPATYLRAHRASAPSVASHYIQTVNFSE